jgi:hypothetical protein
MNLDQRLVRMNQDGKLVCRCLNYQKALQYLVANLLHKPIPYYILLSVVSISIRFIRIPT